MFLPNNPILKTILKRRRRSLMEIRKTHTSHSRWKAEKIRNFLKLPLPQHLQQHIEPVNRNWLHLPDDTMILIFMKLETTELIVNVQYVCSSWRKLAKDPILYRSVFLGHKTWLFHRYKKRFYVVNYAKLASEAVHRSCGQVVQFSCGMMVCSTYSFTKNHLLHIIESSNSGLKSLRLGLSDHIDIQWLTEVVKKIPSLEELYFSNSVFPKSNIEEIGRSCPKLKHLSCRTNLSKSDEAFAIARYMPYLHRLYLHGNSLTNDGLQAILDGCPHLEYIYLIGCFNIDLEQGDLLKKQLKRVKNLRLLEDTKWKECEFDLRPTDEEHSISESLSSKMYSQEAGDCSLSLYNLEFIDACLMYYHPLGS